MQEYREEFWGIFWVDASSTESLERGFLRIASVCALEPGVNTVKKWLSNATESWALIMDNADDPSLDISPYFQVGNRGIVLITTRNPNCENHKTVGSYKLDAMTPDEAVTLFLRRIGVHDPSDALIRDSAKPVVLKLGCLALAVVQAGAVIREGRCKIEEYCAIYSRRRQELLSQRAVQGGEDYQHMVYATWEVSWKMIEEMSSEAGRDAMELLKIFSFFHYERIPEVMFHRAREHFWSATSSSDYLRSHQSDIVLRHAEQEWDSYPLGAAFSLLLSFSLINRDKHDLISIHPLVHTWARDRLCSSDEKTMWTKATSTLALSIPWTLQTVDYRFRRSLVPHIDACLGDRSDRVFHHVADDDGQRMASSFALAYREAGRRHDVQRLTEQAVEVNRENFGEEHGHTLASISTLAIHYSETGREQEALQLMEQVAGVRMRTLGKEDTGTLYSLHLLGTQYGVMGQEEKAVRLLEQVVEASIRILGDDDFKTLDPMSNLAAFYMKVGRREDALRLSEKVVKANERILGMENPETHSAMRNLANRYIDVGRGDKALKLMRAVVFAYKRNLGKEHPTTIGSMRNLAIMYGKMGRQQKALPLAELVMEASKRILGEENPNTLGSIQNLAHIYNMVHRHQDSLRLMEWVVPAYIRILGKEHPETVYSMQNLAACYEMAGRRDEARRLRKEANQGRESEEEGPKREDSEEVLQNEDSGEENGVDSGEEMEEDSEEDSGEESGEEMEEDSERDNAEDSEEMLP